METISRLIAAFLLNACWQIALIAAAAYLGGWLLRKITARQRHVLWIVALALCFLIPALSSLWFSREANSGQGPLVNGATANRHSIDQPRTGSSDAPRPPETAMQSPRPTEPKTTPLIRINRILANSLAALYFAFLCWRGGRLFRAWRRTRTIATSSYPIDRSELTQSIIRKCQAAIKGTRAGFLCSRSVPVPVTIGALKPLVILPEQLLREADANLLTSAIGHELAHVARRDYMLNLIFEVIYLPISFHPAAALVRRRINQTRELGCDELVTERLLDAEVYARSLVRLASSAIPVSRDTAAITVGIDDADILEERVMRMLNRRTLNVRGKKSLLLAAALFLAIPCAAAPFAIGVAIKSQNVDAGGYKDAGPRNREKADGTEVEFVMPALSEGRKAGIVIAWLKKPGQSIERGDALVKIETGKGVVAVEANATGVVERLIAPPGQQAPEGAVLAIIRAKEQQEPKEPQEAGARKAERRRVEVELEAQRRTERQAQEETMAARLAGVQGTKRKEERTQEERGVAEKRELRWRVVEGSKGRVFLVEDEQEPELRARRRAEREEMAKEQSELAKQAKIAMNQAIQIATNLYPGTVVESRLVKERSQACYLLSILSENGTETTTTRVLMSAIDGTVINTFKDDR